MAAKNKKPVKEKKPTDKLADKTAMTKFLQGIFGDAQKKILKRMWKRAQEINGLEEKYEKMSDKELAGQTEILKKKPGYSLHCIPAAFCRPPSAGFVLLRVHKWPGPVHNPEPDRILYGSEHDGNPLLQLRNCAGDYADLPASGLSDSLYSCLQPPEAEGSTPAAVHHADVDQLLAQDHGAQGNPHAH